ncbi:zinc finger protein ZFP2-like isoform X1 [Periplaneta americana]|uniref:zinc finger protein ZFP2-like isoform X1 n=1 Tax=Periplaneta americana TaxID=6978 RepID=UPI0037E6FCA7
MPCCCAVNCSQRSEKNVRLFLLPQGDINKERRKKWIKNIKRKGCLPKRAYVCEKHFTYDMFENNRADGRRLLRWDAVPTIFSYKNIPKSRKEPEKGIVNESEIVMDAIKMEPEVDPLAIQTSNNTDWKEKKFSSEEFNSLNLQSIKIKEENEDHISGVTSEIKFEESSVPFNLSLVKCEVEEELCDLDTIREVQDMKVEAEEKKVSTGSVADGMVSGCGGIAHELQLALYQRPNASISSQQRAQNRTDMNQVTQNASEMCSSFSSALKKCIPKHTGRKEFKCDECGKCLSHKRNLKYHVLNHIGKTLYKCNICGKSLSRQGNLVSHQRIHSREKPFKCDVCGKCFSRMCSLTRHERQHTVEKPYKCQDCGKSYSQSCHLVAHERQHTGEKPYTCDICGKSFSQSSHLMTHERQHTGVKPYKCHVCGKSFSHSNSVIRHERQHTGDKPYKCNVCGKLFSDSGNVIKHERTHSGEKPFKCDVCGKCFSCTSSLRKHLRVHSGEGNAKSVETVACNSILLNAANVRFAPASNSENVPN